MIEGRKIIIQAVIILIASVFLVKLFAIQVMNENYKLAAQHNIVQRITEYPYRGLIFDRNGKYLVVNEPIYDLMIVPMEVNDIDTTSFCEIFNIDKETFIDNYIKAKKYSVIKPSIFLKMISNEEFAASQDRLIEFEGFYIRARSVRNYPHTCLANALGYVGEISKNQLNRDSSKYYQQGDYIGISGIESSYEEALRGERGARYKMVNVRGVEKGDFREGRLDTLSKPGNNLVTTIDLEIQQYAETLLRGKVGSLVAIEPSTGEILAIVSSPSYDPNLLTGREYSRNFAEIQSDTLVPLFNRPIMAMYPPGSMFKTMQALIALQEKVLHPEELIYCDGRLIGDLAPIGTYDLRDAITLSSNNYFYKIFRRIINQRKAESPYIDARIGLENWKRYINAFGVGVQLELDIPNVKSGFIPTVAYYDKIYGENRWKFSNIYSLSIGQGEVLVTPLQMANLAAILANKGYYYQPHVIKEIGEKGQPMDKYLAKQFVGIDSVHFTPVIDGMEAVVRSGSGRRAYISDIEVCGKTSTAENPHGADHSGFMAFAPKDDPQIAIAVYVENAGWGGRAAASTGSLVIEKYLRGNITRPWLEEFVLKGDFLY